MAMHKALHPRDDVDRVYVSRKEGGRGLTSIEDSVNASIQGLEDNIEKCEGGLQPSETIVTSQWTTEWQYHGNKNGKKNYTIGILND